MIIKTGNELECNDMERLERNEILCQRKACMLYVTHIDRIIINLPKNMFVDAILENCESLWGLCIFCRLRVSSRIWVLVRLVAKLFERLFSFPKIFSYFPSNSAKP